MCRARGKRISGTRLSIERKIPSTFLTTPKIQGQIHTAAWNLLEESFTIWTIRARAKDGRTRIEKQSVARHEATWNESETLTTSLGASVQGE
ncbi:hypothetical protein CYLTODRAFT_423510 [Cylindrobasidium torrendii FP15055 ss-10]|uniref:Uncharacterized protein n=1 Tax=Cylindrobasidium torrendii FP15055 ss-10 TaxID=1314674 RepID=A0A0D7B7Z8_9AGAR|nr:hypothetical protein CYLTODRAFT_423510 [Cylindrobasidium torrendii FP15055 ss-10]